VLTDGPGWRWNFFIGLPFAVAAIIVLQRTLHLPALRRRSVTIDYTGALLISAGMTTLLLWVTFAGSKFDWVSWQTAVMIVGALALLTLAVRVESRAALAVGLGLMGTIRYDTSFLLVGVYMFVLGVGVGVSALGAVLGSRVTTLMIAGLARLGIDVSALSGGTGAIPNVSTLPGPIRTVVEASYGQAVADLFLVAVPIALVALVALVAVLFLKEIPLGHRSGVDLRLEVAEALADDDSAKND